MLYNSHTSLIQDRKTWELARGNVIYFCPQVGNEKRRSGKGSKNDMPSWNHEHETRKSLSRTTELFTTYNRIKDIACTLYDFLLM